MHVEARPAEEQDRARTRFSSSSASLMRSFISLLCSCSALASCLACSHRHGHTGGIGAGSGLEQQRLWLLGVRSSSSGCRGSTVLIVLAAHKRGNCTAPLLLHWHMHLLPQQVSSLSTDVMGSQSEQCAPVGHIRPHLAQRADLTVELVELHVQGVQLAAGCKGGVNRKRDLSTQPCAVR